MMSKILEMKWFRKLVSTALIAWLLAPFYSHAEVISANANGFELKIVRNVNADAVTAYDHFIQIGKWWNEDHTWFGAGKNLHLDTKAGGCFCEIKGDQSVLHMTVSTVMPNKQFTMLGGLGPLQAMGLSGALTFTFTSDTKNKTIIVQKYSVHGHSATGFEGLAKIVDTVQAQQMEGLVKFIEKAK